MMFFVLYVFASIETSLAEEFQKSSKHYVFGEEIFLGKLLPGDSLVFEIEGMPYVVLRRTQAQLSTLHEVNNYLVDPLSFHSRQPDGMNSMYRSLIPEFFVALLAPRFSNENVHGCKIIQRDLNDPETQLVGFWYKGGFEERCRGVWYDYAGRVYKGSEKSALNLSIPMYTISSDSKLMIERDLNL